MISPELSTLPQLRQPGLRVLLLILGIHGKLGYFELLNQLKDLSDHLLCLLAVSLILVCFGNILADPNRLQRSLADPLVQPAN
ncbi:uncharacterized protein N7483_010296 [Penicillium malachiteum]|uniref:uncharacterized protein n=1 Tax=Penicillium malachiteum TaxID=1324776 RepID=UPI002548B206|nr:uncharacterized protein N7483_010296 [Penicillium malachiteum]KAJ5713115.1 hypothetical protein N7483_010296 [Penicillium malachiteum]